MQLEHLEQRILDAKTAYTLKRLLDQVTNEIPNDADLGEYLRKSIKNWIQNERHIISPLYNQDNIILFIDKTKLKKKHEQ